MLVIPGSHKVAGPAFVRALANGNAAGGSFNDLRQVTELAAPVPSTGRRGAALFYSSYLVHAAQPFANKRTQRAFWTLSMCRRDNDRWTRFANPFIYGEREHMLPFFHRHHAPSARPIRLARTRSPVLHQPNLGPFGAYPARH